MHRGFAFFAFGTVATFVTACGNGGSGSGGATSATGSQVTTTTTTATGSCTTATTSTTGVTTTATSSTGTGTNTCALGAQASCMKRDMCSMAGFENARVYGSEMACETQQTLGCTDNSGAIAEGVAAFVAALRATPAPGSAQD